MKIGFTKETFHNWVQYTPWNAHRASCQLAQPVLESVAGEYRREDGFPIFIASEGQRLYVQFGSRWRAKLTLEAESPTCLFLQEGDVQFILQTTRQEKVETLIFRNGGHDSVLTRVAAPSRTACSSMTCKSIWTPFGHAEG